MNSREEVERLLGSRLNLQLATIDSIGYPNIQPVWFRCDTLKNRLYILTSSMSKKALNVRNNSKVYFSVDDCNVLYKGVKGRGTATISTDPTTVVSTANKTRQKDAVVIEIVHKFISTWDFGRMQST